MIVESSEFNFNTWLRSLLVVGWMAITSLGCRPPAADPPADSGSATVSEAAPTKAPLRLVVIDDEPLAQVIARQWQAHARERLEMVNLGSDQVEAGIPDADVIIYPSPLMGPLIQARVIDAWPARWQPQAGSSDHESLDANYNWAGLLPVLTRQELRWGNELYGVSFGSPQWMLFYREDLFQQWNLTPPKTWNDYQSLLVTIHERLQANGSLPTGTDPTTSPTTDPSASLPLPTHATLEPLAKGWAANTLLARAASIRHPNQYSTYFQFVTMEPLIDQPPFQRALDQLWAAVPFMPSDAWSCSPEEVMHRFLRGDTVMAISWPNRARAETTSGSDSTSASARFAINLQPLPGSDEVYQMTDAKWQKNELPRSVSLLGTTGRIGSITRRCRFPDAACNLLLWLTGDEQSARIASRSRQTTAFRLIHLREPGLWVEPGLENVAARYAELLGELQSSETMMTLRIPGHGEYLEVLDQAIRPSPDTVDRSPRTTTETLQAVAERWNEITNRRGRDPQRQAYAESLGLQAP